MRGEGGGEVLANTYVQPFTWRPNKLWRSNTIPMTEPILVPAAFVISNCTGKYVPKSTAIITFFKKIIEVHGYIGVKSNFETFL